jgi:hypothetical protein
MSDLDPCIECAKGKQTSMHKYTANRMTNVLELIHTDIYEPFSIVTRNCHVYFISFIDNYSRYDYIYLIKEKDQVLDTFKSFKSDERTVSCYFIGYAESTRGYKFYDLTNRIIFETQLYGRLYIYRNIVGFEMILIFPHFLPPFCFPTDPSLSLLTQFQKGRNRRRRYSQSLYRIRGRSLEG